MARDPETRRRSREAQNLRRKLQRRAKRLQARAKLEKDEGIKQVYRREAKNINEAVRRSAFKRGESDTKKTQKFQRLLDLNEAPTRQRNRNLFIQSEMRRAMDKQQTIFGAPVEGRVKVKTFFMIYQRDWQSSESPNRYESILAAHPGLDLWDLYSRALDADMKKGGVTFEMFVADYLGIQYDEVDTTSPAWNHMINEKFDSLDSPTQKAIAVAYGALH